MNHAQKRALHEIAWDASELTNNRRAEASLSFQYILEFLIADIFSVVFPVVIGPENCSPFYFLEAHGRGCKE